MKKLSLIILAFLAVLASCKKAPEVNLKYVDVEREVLTIGTTTATFQCDYQYIATLKSAKIYYGLSESSMSSKEMQVVSSSLYAEITGLTSNTTYNYYYEFDNGYNTMNSGTKSFVTEASATVVLPTVITSDVTDITAESAVSGGNVISDGGGTVTARGICWSTSLNPTINDSLTTDGEGIGSFISNMTGLSSNTTYHVRAYATNEAGTAYGLDKEFTTPVVVPEGAINGLFTINENGDKVYFSQGNLQYIISTQTWSFMEHQYDKVEYDQMVVGSNYEYYDTVSLFGWGTSGWDNGNLRYQPYETGIYSLPELNGNNGFGYGPTDGTNYNFDLTGDYANSDWGVYNAISNGGNISNLWRTLTIDEWDYVLNHRSTQSGFRYAKCNVDNMDGVVILPDNWSNSIFTLYDINEPGASFSTNNISIADWEILESNGVVFLRCAGGRNGAHVSGNGGVYWSISCCSTYGAYTLSFNFNEVYNTGDVSTTGFDSRYSGANVRLVQDAE